MRALNLVDIPYVAPADTLPEPLPSLSEIHASKDVLDDQRSLVVAVGKHFVVKYGCHVDLTQGQTMLYLKDTTSVSIPTVYAMFRDADSKKNYIIMERIHGSRLDKEWNNLSHEEKDEISCKLKEYFDELRALPSPGGYCSVGKQPLQLEAFWTDDPPEPLADEAMLHERLFTRCQYLGMPKYEENYYREMIPRIMRCNRPVFTHCDLQGKNILFRRTLQGNKTFDITLIDWEYSGWYPWFWEYAMSLMACAVWRTDWAKYLDKIVPGKLVEALWIDTLLRKLLEVFFG